MQDWQQQPLVDIKVTKGDCEDNYEPIFFREWLGTEAGCVSDKSAGLEPLIPLTQFQGDEDECDMVQAIDSVK